MRIAIIYLPHHRLSLTLFIKDKWLLVRTDTP
ncbi:hypothetical protein T08_3760 [Trichinella sp. T8]|nr:hypothetical protein T08_3760 [Trichinella sp. T8]